MVPIAVIHSVALRIISTDMFGRTSLKMKSMKGVSAGFGSYISIYC